MRGRALAVCSLACLLPQAARGQTAPDSGAFIVRLGTDTVVVERYVRTAERLTIDAVQRSPSTSLHRLVLTIGPQDRVTHAEWTVTAPGASTPATRREFQFQADSAVVTTVQGGNTRTERVSAAGAIPLSGPFYTPYELAIRRAVASNAQRTTVPLLAGASVVPIPIERIGADSVALTNQFQEPMRAHIDPQGRLLHLHTPAFTSVERLRWVDLDRLSSDFAQRDRNVRGLGPLSVRHAARARVGAANIWLDYSRPAMRGRPIWGALVPWNQVWRLGANDATHFATDRTLELGNLTLQPGTYTLFLLPTPERWTLIVSRATGIGGLDYDAAQDLGRVEMATETVAQPAELLTIQVVEGQTGARLEVQWDRTRATVPVRVP